MHVQMITKGSLCGTLSLQIDGTETSRDPALYAAANRMTRTEGLIFVNPYRQPQLKLLEAVQNLFPIVIWNLDGAESFPPEEVYRYAKWLRLERDAVDWTPTPANEVIITGHNANDPIPYRLQNQELFVDVSASNADFVQRALEQRIRMCPTTIQYSEREIDVQEIRNRQKQNTLHPDGGETEQS